MPVPQINPNDEHAVVVRWHVATGARVRAGQPLATLETTKATFDVDAPRAGYAFFEHEPNAELARRRAGRLDRGHGRAAADPAHASAAIATSPARAGGARFTRKALKLMKEHGLTAADFPGDRRVDADGRAHGGSAKHEVVAASQRHRDGVEPLEQSPSKITEIQALTAVYEQAVPSTVTVALSLRQARRAPAAALPASNGPVSLLEARDPRSRALAAGLSGAQRLLRRRAGVALSSGRGRLRHQSRPCAARARRQDAAQLSLRDVARAVRDLSLRYMRDELTIDDVTGGTFTITDLSAKASCISCRC